MMREVTWDDFAVFLRQLRERHGLSQLAMARTLGCDRIHIWRLEHSQRRPSKMLLRAISHTWSPSPQERCILIAFEAMIEYQCESMTVETDVPAEHPVS